MKSQSKLNEFVAFENANELPGGGYSTLEAATEAARLQMEWWGSNLVFLGIEEKNSRFFPMFNVFD